jgi:hypothetical protein
MDDFSLARPAGHLIMGDGSGPDELAKKDRAKALSGAASIDTATTQVDKPSRTKNLITECSGTRLTPDCSTRAARGIFPSVTRTETQYRNQRRVDG